MAVDYSEDALRDLGSISQDQRGGIIQKATRLDDPSFHHYQLRNVTWDGQRAYRARSGSYRILYVRPSPVDVWVYGIRHRSVAYRRR